MSEKFQDEIFISYAHIDNVSPKPGMDGWITRFHSALEVRIAQVRGETPRIFRDPKLQGNDVFADVLVERLQKSGLMISVLTPRYLKSEWCSRELKEFCRTLKKSGSLVVGDHKARVFKVVKTNVPLDKTPEEIQPVIGYEFFRLDEKGRPQELDELYGEEAEHEFWARLNDLAYDIAELLDLLEAKRGDVSQKPSVYLAETVSALKGERDELQRDLKRHGYTVLPDRMLPLVKDDLEQFLKAEIARCKVSVHLLGAVYGVAPEGTDESLTMIQHRVARELSKVGQLARLVWIKAGPNAQDERQKKFLEQVRTDPGIDEGADVLETPLEELKTNLYERLKAAETPPAVTRPSPAAAGGRTSVYMVYDELDKEAVTPVRDFLVQQGCKVTRPLFEGDEKELREDHEANLRDCDAVLIYYGKSSAAWQRRKLREAGGSMGLGRQEPLRAIGVLIGPPPKDEKTEAQQDLQSDGAVAVMVLPDSFDPDALKDFVARIQTARKQESV